MYGKHAWPTCRITPILHVRRSLFSYTRQFCMYTYGAGGFWTTLYEKHTTSTYTRTPILVLDHLVRKTYHIYIHSNPNSACTKNIPHLHTLEPQFFMYAKHAWPTYTIDPIIYVRGARLAYTRATTNRLTRRGARPTPLAGPPTILLRNNKKINQRPAYMHNVREAFAAAPTPTPSAMPSAARAGHS